MSEHLMGVVRHTGRPTVGSGHWRCQRMMATLRALVSAARPKVS
jgi:hypothetical protein